jgi:hypothetical protein
LQWISSGWLAGCSTARSARTAVSSGIVRNGSLLPSSPNYANATYITKIVITDMP